MRARVHAPLLIESTGPVSSAHARERTRTSVQLALKRPAQAPARGHPRGRLKLLTGRVPGRYLDRMSGQLFVSLLDACVLCRLVAIEPVLQVSFCVPPAERTARRPPARFPLNSRKRRGAPMTLDCQDR